MTGYRVAEEPSDPLAVDEEVCRKQRYRQRLFAHSLVTFISFGAWLPGLLFWIATASGRTRRWAAGYAVRIQGGTLVVGNATELRTVPLDAIADVAVKDGYVSVSIRGALLLQLLGLRDPVAASRAILEARDAHVRGLRGDVREEVLEAEVGFERKGARLRR